MLTLRLTPLTQLRAICSEHANTETDTTNQLRAICSQHANTETDTTKLLRAICSEHANTETDTTNQLRAICSEHANTETDTTNQLRAICSEHANTETDTTNQLRAICSEHANTETDTTNQLRAICSEHANTETDTTNQLRAICSEHANTETDTTNQLRAICSEHANTETDTTNQLRAICSEHANTETDTTNQLRAICRIVNEKLLSDYLNHIFPSTSKPQQPAAAFRKPLTFLDLGDHLDRLLAEGEPAEESKDVDGRLGPPTVVLDHTSGFEGLLLVDDDLLGVIGHSNFSSIRATTCVFKGKWSYEVLISSQGLMQIGWCTLNCRFNQECKVYLVEGVLMRFLLSILEGGGSVDEHPLIQQLLDLMWLLMECKVYLVEGVLMRFLLSILEGGGSVDEHPLIQQLLDLMWLLMEDYEVNECLKQLMMSLLRAYRFSPIIPDLGLQIHYLRLTTAILRHEKSRKYLLSNGRDEREAREESPEERLRRRAYERGCQRLKKRIEVVEELQVQILKLLLNNKDKGTNFAHPILIFAAAASISLKLYKPSLFQGEASRYIFLNKFRKFLQENASNRGNPAVLCPPEYMVCFLHRLIAAVRFYWEESKRKSSGVLGSEEAYVPPQLFYNGKVDYFDLQRLGGLLSHLKKTLKDDLASKANIIIDPSEIQAMSMDDLDEDEENGTVQRPAGATAMGGALARPSWLSSPTLGRANRFLSTAAVSLMSPRRPLGTPERMKVRTLSVEQRTEEDIEGSHGNDGLLQGRPPEESDQPIAEKSLLEIVDGIVMMYNLTGQGTDPAGTPALAASIQGTGTAGTPALAASIQGTGPTGTPALAASIQGTGPAGTPALAASIQGTDPAGTPALAASIQGTGPAGTPALAASIQGTGPAGTPALAASIQGC
ncbi:E3 ubiquitin-protein ligase RNF123 [Acipenser ruthenus]|uniref:E3 ubiquitin-protein ligase RNF123 n=1 Tax=Acipenser ruthenus TaxID=7906 RepID=A0A662YPF0_ACIRT|nr:E3 ubiquitin-protein ligase RNF123 [Acipenser ruthenus]